MQDKIPVQRPPSLIQQRPEIYPNRINRPNPLLEPSYNPKVMAKQLPKYEGLLNPQPIEIELRGRLPSYDVDKAIQNIHFQWIYLLLKNSMRRRGNCLTKYLKKLSSENIFLNR